MPPVIGLNLPANGPHDPAIPMASRSIVHMTAFWYTIGWSHQSPTFQKAGRSDVARIRLRPPRV
jgi:hypothetical protein